MNLVPVCGPYLLYQLLYHLNLKLVLLYLLPLFFRLLLAQAGI